MIIARHAEPTLLQLAEGYPVVVVTGPRQSGKTTLVRKLFPDRPYVSLEDLDVRAFATDDPRGFLGQYPDGAVLDEAQRCPTLFPYLQTQVDADRRPGLFILSGSQQFNLLSGISQSLAGRAALFTLLPFSLPELAATGLAPERMADLLFKGLYPPIYDRKLDPSIWYGNYTATYIERDVRQLVNVRDLSAFQVFIRMCAGRTGQLLNLSALAADCGISHNTAKAWLSVLEAGYIVHLLRPHHRNFGKRLVKTPKLYFVDPGLAAWLLGVHDNSQIEFHPARGALFETWVVAELLKSRYNRALAPNLSFWRDRSGHEIDVILEAGAALTPVEIKSGATINRDFFTALERWQSLVEQGGGRAWLVYGGDERQQRSTCEVLPWREIARLAP